MAAHISYVSRMPVDISFFTNHACMQLQAQRMVQPSSPASVQVDKAEDSRFGVME